MTNVNWFTAPFYNVRNHVQANGIEPTTADMITLAEAQLAQAEADGFDAAAVGMGGDLIGIALP